MKLRTFILFAAAAPILCVVGAIALSYAPVRIPAVTPMPDPLVLSYRDQRTEVHEVSIGSGDPEYKQIAGMFASPGKGRFFDPVDYMGQIWIDTPALTIDFAGDSLLLLQQHESAFGGWSNNSRKLTSQDRVLLALLRARCERDADSSHKPYWVR